MPPETLAESGTITLGFNAYWWGESYQDALLAKAILPLFQQLIAECGLSRLWYDRATLRGPHIFALMTVPVELEKQAQALMLAALTKARNDQPSRYQISSQELQALHLDAGDKALCDADHEDGLAANNTFAIFVHRDADTATRTFIGMLKRVASSGDAWNVLPCLPFTNSRRDRKCSQEHGGTPRFGGF